MAVWLEGTIKRYIGESTDVKPVVGTDVNGAVMTARDLPPGSSFKETDTGRIARWDGEKWTYDPPMDERLLAEMQSLNGTLGEVRELLELIAAKL